MPFAGQLCRFFARHVFFADIVSLAIASRRLVSPISLPASFRRRQAFGILMFSAIAVIFSAFADASRLAGCQFDGFSPAFIAADSWPFLRFLSPLPFSFDYYFFQHFVADFIFQFSPFSFISFAASLRFRFAISPRFSHAATPLSKAPDDFRGFRHDYATGFSFFDITTLTFVSCLSRLPFFSSFSLPLPVCRLSRHFLPSSPLPYFIFISFSLFVRVFTAAIDFFSSARRHAFRSFFAISMLSFSRRFMPLLADAGLPDAISLFHCRFALCFYFTPPFFFMIFRCQLFSSMPFLLRHAIIYRHFRLIVCFLMPASSFLHLLPPAIFTPPLFQFSRFTLLFFIFRFSHWCRYCISPLRLLSHFIDWFSLASLFSFSVFEITLPLHIIIRHIFSFQPGWCFFAGPLLRFIAATYFHFQPDFVFASLRPLADWLSHIVFTPHFHWYAFFTPLPIFIASLLFRHILPDYYFHIAFSFGSAFSRRRILPPGFQRRRRLFLRFRLRRHIFRAAILLRFQFSSDFQLIIIFAVLRQFDVSAAAAMFRFRSAAATPAVSPPLRRLIFSFSPAIFSSPSYFVAAAASLLAVFSLQHLFFIFTPLVFFITFSFIDATPPVVVDAIAGVGQLVFTDIFHAATVYHFRHIFTGLPRQFR